MQNFTYLALGDSYTIGEQVLLTESFPYQLIQLLRNNFSAADPLRQFAAAEIIAKTGWTTDELLMGLKNYTFLPHYDFVTLLIGVNNQYRGRTAKSFEPEFKELLRLAIQRAGNDPRRVAVLSIPDWGLTPFAEGKDSTSISIEIDSFNTVCEAAANEYYCHYINITSEQRRNSSNEAYLAPDKLHPSALEYAQWARQVFGVMNSN